MASKYKLQTKVSSNLKQVTLSMYFPFNTFVFFVTLCVHHREHKAIFFINKFVLLSYKKGHTFNVKQCEFVVI